MIDLSRSFHALFKLLKLDKKIMFYKTTNVA